ncbi:MAG: N-acetylmuramoyl-L-alanine amidase [Acidimicrobiia bacterium]
MALNSGMARRWSRREFIHAAGLGLMGGSALLVNPAPARGLTINPRSAWAIDRPPKGPLPAEDVRFLLVHHSASRAGHTPEQAPAILRSFYDLHTSAEKGWNDIAYNFLIDSGGGIWEGRSGSVAGAVAGDATGGNQGFSQLVCLIGDFNASNPSGAALGSLIDLLAWLADKHGVSTVPGSQVSFTSKGSSLWHAGSSVTTATITGHRAMSATACPGSNLNRLVATSLTAEVDAARTGTPATSPSTTAAGPIPTISATGPVHASVVESSPTTPKVDVVTAAAISSVAGAAPGWHPLLWMGAGFGAAATTGLAWRYRRMSR